MRNAIEHILERSNEQERFNKLLALTLTDCSREALWAEYTFTVKEWSKNPSGGVHGGVISSLFDTAMGITAVGLSGMNVTTTDLSVSFVRPMNGETYTYRAECSHLGKRMLRMTGKAFNAETGELCATAMASFMIIGSMEKPLRV
ncbi:uncharacterized protein (TIGR00369 family) [Clostridiales Family XIII bacterium PM5-7]